MGEGHQRGECRAAMTSPHMIRDTETFAILLDTVRRFVRERLIPAEQALADTDAIPGEILKEMRDIGLFGLTIPPRVRRPRTYDGRRGIDLDRDVPRISGVSLYRGYQ